nr:TPA: trypsin-like serine protease-like protein [Oryctes rhinoceros nudivirus]
MGRFRLLLVFSILIKLLIVTDALLPDHTHDEQFLEYTFGYSAEQAHHHSIYMDDDDDIDDDNVTPVYRHKRMLRDESSPDQPKKLLKVYPPHVLPPEYNPIGTPVEAGDFYWRAFFKMSNVNGTIWCGGAILSETYVVITAACLYDYITAHFYTEAYLLLGGLKSDSFTYTIPINITRQAKIHPNFNIRHPSMENNIALFKLDEALPFSSNINKIQFNYVPDDENADLRIVGYGRTLSNVPITDLRYHYMKVVPEQECFLIYGTKVCNMRMFSATGRANEFTNVCRVESGAPLSYHENFGIKPQLLGLASYVSELGCVGYPDGYVYLWRYRSWIRDILNS